MFLIMNTYNFSFFTLLSSCFARFLEFATYIFVHYSMFGLIFIYDTEPTNGKGEEVPPMLRVVFFFDVGSVGSVTEFTKHFRNRTKHFAYDTA